MAGVFAAGGYRTGLFGKWHLGDNYPYRPQDRGFQETLYFPSSHIPSAPDHGNNDYFDGVTGVALPIARARLRIADVDQSGAAQEGDKAVTFTARLRAGRTQMQTWFYDSEGGELCGAYYVYVRRK